MSQTKLISLFNLDLHISVIADVKNIITTLFGDKIQIIDWSISGHTWVFGRQRTNVDIVNQATWKQIDKKMINRFYDRYKNYLSQFDAFIVTHTPVFALLYEKTNKPIIVINSCRYEQPFSWNGDLKMWNYLNGKLKEMYDKKQLTVVCNNKADLEYLKLGTGIEAHYIPSLCLYTQSKYTGKSDNLVVYNNKGIVSDIPKLIDKTRLFKVGYKWSDLYQVKGIIHISYEVSTMSIFEQYSANVPLFFPAKKFLKQLIREKRISFYGSYVKNTETHIIEHPFPPELKPALDHDNWVDFWIDKADYYDENNMKYITYFNSFKELQELISSVNYNEISENMKLFNEHRTQYVLLKWKDILNKTFLNLNEMDEYFSKVFPYVSPANE